MFNLKFIKIFGLLLFLNLFNNIFAQENNNLFNNNLYLGDQYYKDGDLGKAMLFWKRAELNSGFFNKIKVLERISLLKEITGQAKIYNYKIFKNIKFIKDYLISVIRTLPYIVIKFLFLLFWILIFLNIRKLIRRKQKLLIIFLFKNTLLFGAIFVLRHNLDFKNYGVILQNNVNIYSNMDPNSKIDAILPSATVVKIINQFDGFYQIKNKGTIGFVDQKCLEKICN